MPTKPLTPCRTPGCPHLTPGGHCPQHLQARQRNHDRTRPSSHKRGYDRAWFRLRHAHLAAHPLCEDCKREGHIVAATQVDHVIPHKMNDHLRLDPNNLRSLCATHHSRKTVRQDGGWGRHKVTP